MKIILFLKICSAVNDQIEPYHIINSKTILSMNAPYQLKTHFPLHSVVFKAPCGVEGSLGGDSTPADSDSDPVDLQ